MKTSAILTFAAVAFCSVAANAQISTLGAEAGTLSWMNSAIQRHATPVMALLTKDAAAFRQTNKPDYKNNDVPYEFTTTKRTFEGVLLAPVSGHVPLGGDAATQERNARNYADHNETTLLHNGKEVAKVKHNGAYVAKVPFKIQLQPGKNTIVMSQRNLKTHEHAGVGGFPMGRQFNITVTAGSRNSMMRGSRNSMMRARRSFRRPYRSMRRR